MTFDYSAKHIQVLEGLEPVKKRPAMYIGSTDIRGLHHCINEIIDNSVDEALAGFAKNVWVILNKDGTAIVCDDGRGIPVDIMPQFKKCFVCGLELSLSVMQPIKINHRGQIRIVGICNRCKELKEQEFKEEKK